jgi:hypothetical protein
VASKKELADLSLFYLQSLRGEPCGEPASSPACSFQPLTPAEWTSLEELQPFSKPVDTRDACNLAQFGYAEWEAMKTHPLYPLLKGIYQRLLCRSFGTTKPRVNCVKDPDSGRCMCCCHVYVPMKFRGQFKCVLKRSQGEDDAVCKRL